MTGPPGDSSIFGSGLGSALDAAIEADFADPPEDEEKTQAPQATEAPPAPVAETPPPPSPDPLVEPSDTEPPEPPEPEVVVPRFAGKYSTPEALEQGYREMWSLQQRTAEERNALHAQLEQASQLLERVRPLIEQSSATPAPAVSQALRAAQEAGLDEDTLRATLALADAIATSKVATVEQQMAARTEAERQAERAEAIAYRSEQAASELLAAHPDAAAREADMIQVIQELHIDTSEGLDPEAMQIVYEAATDADFRAALQAFPAWYETDEGIEAARQWAAFRRERRGETTPPGAPHATDARREQARLAARVEPGHSSAPPSLPAKPSDEWDDVLELARAERETAKKSIFS